MQDRKSYDMSANATDRSAVMHNRRLDEVRRNFAIGSRRNPTAQSVSAQPRSKRNVKV
jgi:hypothetical protein